MALKWHAGGEMAPKNDVRSIVTSPPNIWYSVLTYMQIVFKMKNQKPTRIVILKIWAFGLLYLTSLCRFSKATCYIFLQRTQYTLKFTFTG